MLALGIEKQLTAEAKKRQGQRTDLKPHVVATSPQRSFGRARESAAEMVGASPRYVQDAKPIAQDAPEILEHVKQGTLSIPQAKKVAALPVEQRS